MSRNEIEKNEKTLDVNTKAVISKLKEQGIDASVDEHDHTWKRLVAECELNYYGAFRGDPYSYKSRSIRARLPNGIEVHIVTDSIPDRAVISFAAPEASEIYHREDIPKSRDPNCYVSGYYPNIAYDIGLNNPGIIIDIMRHIADAATLREISYADLITASVQKYFPEKAEEMTKSMLVRNDLTENEIEMLTRRNKNGDIDGYYSPRMTVLIPEGKTMTEKETAWLIDKVEKCAYLKSSLIIIHGKGSAVKDCLKFLKERRAYEPLRYNNRRDGEIVKKYTEFVTNKEVIAAALSSDNLEGRNEILSATKEYKSELLQEAYRKYHERMEYCDSERYMDDLCEEYIYEMEYEGLDIRDVAKSYAQEAAGEDLQHAEKYANSIAAAPAAYIMHKSRQKKFRDELNGRTRHLEQDSYDEFEL